jgi:N-acetylneuraminate synthase
MPERLFVPFQIASRSIGDRFPPYIIAELSANHGGSISRAFETIDAAQDAGADAIKIQTYTPDTMTLDCDLPGFRIEAGLWKGYKLYDLYREAHTPYEWHADLFAHARKRGITIFSTPFDDTAVDLLESLDAPAYKIASFELTDLQLIERVASTGRPLIVSTGMASLAEVSDAVGAARRCGCRDLVLLHCVSGYPTPIGEINLRRMATLAREFDVAVGLSDHTLGTTASVAAVALGATVIEKHFTLRRADGGPDSEFSLEPAELAELCRTAREAWEALGTGEFVRQNAESGNAVFRRSVYFVRDLARGSIVTPADIRRIRPGFGLSARHFPELVGRKVNRDVTAGTPTSWDCFEST